MIPADARILAEAHAARDRDTLARLVNEGRVRRDGFVGANVPGARAFVRDILHRTDSRPPVNLAIRPKKRKR